MKQAMKSPLLTDLYQLTMMQSYLEHGMEDTAVFELFVRRLPEGRNFLMFAGLEQALEFLEQLHFSPRELEWVEGSGRFSKDFVAWLAHMRFEGDVYAMPEGEIFFPDEPVLRVVAPLPVAQLVESRLINILHFQTVIASKAVRMRLAAPDALLVDFGFRRAHEAAAGLLAARAAYIAGLDGTSTVLAAAELGIPVFGTMAHSYILAHDGEQAAFQHFARTHPDHVTLLIDTYDTETGAARVVEIAPDLARDGIHIRAVRLDSGDLVAHARRVRVILDHGGLRDTQIFVSGNLDEYAIRDMVGAGAPINGFGIGTRMVTASDAPYLDCAYKLQEYAGRPRRKTSEGKATWPGRKQVFRYLREGHMYQDVVALESEAVCGADPLLQQVMQTGRTIASPSLAEVRAYAQRRLACLPARLRRLDSVSAYPVRISRRLRALASRLEAQQAHGTGLATKSGSKGDIS